MKAKKIKRIALAGGLIIVGLSTAINTNAGNCKTLFYPAIVNSATKDLSTEELTQSYYEVFKESLLAETLVKEFNNIEQLFIEETKTSITFDITVESDKVMKDEAKLYKEILNDLFEKINTINSNKNIVFEISVNYETYESNTKQCVSDRYRICKSKFTNNSLAISKTKFFNMVDSWDSSSYVYDVKKEAFRSENPNSNVFEDEVYNEVIDSLYPDSIMDDLYPYEVEKTTHYKNDSVDSSVYLELLDTHFDKANPKKLMGTLLDKVSSEDKAEEVTLGVSYIDENKKESLKFYSATLN